MESNENNNEKLTQEDILKKELHNNKQVEYYASCINGWVTTRMEKDKSILTLSTAGIGVLVSFFSNIDTSNLLIYTLYILSILCFVIAILSALKIFDENSNYFMNIVKNENPKSISYLDKILYFSFIFGLVFTIILSLSIMSNKKNETKEKVAFNLLEDRINLLEKNIERKIMESKQIDLNSTVVIDKKSVNKLDKIKHEEESQQNKDKVEK